MKPLEAMNEVFMYYRGKRQADVYANENHCKHQTVDQTGSHIHHLSTQPETKIC